MDKKTLEDIKKHITAEEMKNICSAYGVQSFKDAEVLDTSHGEQDIRLNIVLDRKFVLRLNNAPVISEERLASMQRLIERYATIGLTCPAFLRDDEGKFLRCHGDFLVYMSEYADFFLAEEQPPEDEQQFEREIMQSIGKLAQKYTGVDLSDIRSMWSIIDLAPMDVDIDEKQENLNSLVEILRECAKKEADSNDLSEGDFESEYGDLLSLADRVEAFNEQNRAKIKAVLKDLPRCVYQGDLNWANLLVEDGHLKGLIDFNMSGTEVNINCFINETDRTAEEDEVKVLSAEQLYTNSIAKQDALLQEIWKYYELNEVENSVFENYRSITLISQYPNVCLFNYFLDQEEYRAKIVKWLELILARGI